MWQFDAIGTKWVIETPTELSDMVQLAVEQRIEQFDIVYSRFRDDSFVATIARQAGTYTFPEDSDALMTLYRKLYDATNGAVTPLVGDSLANLGYDKNYSLQFKKETAVPGWDEVMQWNGSTVTTQQPVTLDFGAVGKGYLIDLVAAELEKHGVQEYTIDASGDLRYRGQQPQTIGLENPHDPSRVIGTMTIQNESLCASATNRRRWGQGLHHVIDGRTGRPTDEVIATWVSAETTAVADGLATALFFVGAKELQQWDFRFVRLFANGKIEHSEGFVGELFI